MPNPRRRVYAFHLQYACHELFKQIMSHTYLMKLLRRRGSEKLDHLPTVDDESDARRKPNTHIFAGYLRAI